MKIVISGGWGYGNIGDEVIAKCTKALVEKTFENAEIIFTSYDTRDFYYHHSIEAQESVHSILEKQEVIEMSMIADVLDNPDKYGLHEFVANFSEDTLFIMSGGGYFDGRWKTQFIARVLEIELAVKYGAKAIIIGQSVGPFLSEQETFWAKRSLEKCSYICVRDYATKEFLQQLVEGIDINTCCDLALIISDVFPIKPCANKKYMFVVQEYARYVNNGVMKHYSPKVEALIKRVTLRKWRYDRAWVKLIHNILSDKAEGTLTINIQSTNRKANAHYVVYAKNILKKCASLRLSIQNQMTVDEFCQAIATSKAVISVKMHPLIVASSYGVPVISLSQHYKMDAFMEWIKQENRCFCNKNFPVDIITQLVLSEPKDIDGALRVIEDRKIDIYHMGAEIIQAIK